MQKHECMRALANVFSGGSCGRTLLRSHGARSFFVIAAMLSNFVALRQLAHCSRVAAPRLIRTPAGCATGACFASGYLLFSATCPGLSATAACAACGRLAWWRARVAGRTQILRYQLLVEATRAVPEHAHMRARVCTPPHAR
eukprot:7059711-Alexandrium_andersonii.AAC.1